MKMQCLLENKRFISCFESKCCFFFVMSCICIIFAKEIYSNNEDKEAAGITADTHIPQCGFL
ncbi:MAG: hypothetical protein PUF39_02535, partial [Prevotellaceae bacterium]|nr:hypothetical protein [Prevotellaceae bacterium]